MATLKVALTLSCLVAAVTSVSDPHATVSINSAGQLEFRIPDDGYQMVGLHFSVNKPVAGVGAGEYNVDIRTKTGTDWVYTEPSVQLKTGDTVNYWLLAISSQDGSGHQTTDQSWNFAPPTTPTTTTTTTTTTAPKLNTVLSGGHTTGTPAPGTVAPNTGSGSGTGGSSSGGGPSGHGGGPSDYGGGSAGTGTVGGGTGSCGCSGGLGFRQGFVDSSQCTSYPCLIFEDNFDFLNHQVWEHEITAGGGGNWEFQYYTNNRSNSYTRDGILYLKPGAVDTCTTNAFFGCKRDGAPGRIVNPIKSARIRSSRGFNFKYGKVEVEAKLPVGDWLWPAIWMLPRLDAYGIWPASGEIDIMESRGNMDYHDPQGQSQGVNSIGSTMHFGPDYFHNAWPKAHAEKKLSSGTFADDFHKFGVEWDETAVKFTVDGEEILKVDPGPEGFWKFSEFDQVDGLENPWAQGSHMAPFDQEYYLILNVAVGGVGFFPDENQNRPNPKPWTDNSEHAMDTFWAARNQWYPTWHPDQNNGEDAALKVNYIKVWKTKPDA
nr:hypothetical protein BaRGS_033431 [Batillaria attramentaria]